MLDAFEIDGYISGWTGDQSRIDFELWCSSFRNPLSYCYKSKFHKTKKKLRRVNVRKIFCNSCSPSQPLLVVSCGTAHIRAKVRCTDFMLSFVVVYVSQCNIYFISFSPRCPSNLHCNSSFSYYVQVNINISKQLDTSTTFQISVLQNSMLKNFLISLSIFEIAFMWR